MTIPQRRVAIYAAVCLAAVAALAIMPNALSIAYVVAAFVLMVSVIVVVHEFGHYIAGRAFGLVGTRFSLGFGPKLIGRTDSRGTEWRLSPILLGGYVSFPGDDPNTPVEDGQITLNRLPRWKRAVVVGAGPAINLVLAVLLFATIAAVWGYPVGKPIVQSVSPNSAAAAAGIREGDRLDRIGATRIVTQDDVTRAVVMSPGTNMRIEWFRNGTRMTNSARIGERQVYDGAGGSARIGVLGVVLPRAWERATNPVSALTKGVSDGIFMTSVQIRSLGQVVTGRRDVTEMSGPVRIAKASAQTLSLGALPFLYLMAMISIAVGIMNLLPIPALDGGHLATYAVEGLLGRDLSETAREGLARIGFVAIVALAAFALAIDMIVLS